MAIGLGIGIPFYKHSSGALVFMLWGTPSLDSWGSASSEIWG